MKKIGLVLLGMGLVLSPSFVGAAEKHEQAGAHKKPSPVLVDILGDFQRLDSADAMAIAAWCKGEGRKALRERGVTDKQIGPARFDFDKIGEASPK